MTPSSLIRSCRNLLQLLLFCLLSAAILAAPHLVYGSCDNPQVATCEGGSSAAFFELRTNGYTWCNLALPVGLDTITVSVYTIPIQKIRFALPDPPIGTVVDEWWGVSYTGDRVSGIEADLGGCSPVGHVVIGQLIVLVAPEEVACAPWGVDETYAEVQDCEGLWRPAETSEEYFVVDETNYYCPGSCGMSCCPTGLPFYDLYPRDGETNVPVDATLSWSGEAPWGIYPNEGKEVRIGTDHCSNTELYAIPQDQNSFTPDFLEPHTTYYWQPSWGINPSGCNNGFTGAAPMHSFTTGGPIRTQPSTWSSVKALYQNP
jgi:hypothetical protein